MSTDGHFDPQRFFPLKDQIGSGKLFGSVTARDTAVRQGLLDPGYLVGGRRINTGQQLNDFLIRSLKQKELPEGFGGQQVGAGRKKRKQQTEAVQP